MAPSDGEMVALAQQPAGLLPGRVGVRVEPMPGNDPYGAGACTVRLRPEDGGELEITVSAGVPPAEAIARLLDVAGEYGSEELGWWGVALPLCPGHPHCARIGVDAGSVVLTCPSTGAVVARVVPA